MYIGAYIVYLSVIAIGLWATKSKIVNAIQCALVVALFAYSEDYLDYWVYQEVYDKIRFGEETFYEIGYEWFCSLCIESGLDYIGFRMTIGILFCCIVSYIIRLLTCHPNIVWSCLLIFSAMFDALLLRNSLGMILGLIAILVLIKAQLSIKGYGIATICITMAALCHGAYWIMLLFIPLWYIINKWENGYKYVLILVMAMYCIFILNNNLIFKIYSNLLVREASVDKYMTDSYASMAGAIYNVLKYLIIISPILYYTSKNKKEQNTKVSTSLRNLFNTDIWKLNIIFSIILVPQYFAMNFSRLFRVLILINYIFIANQIGNSNCKKWNPKAIGICYASIMACLMFFYESVTTLNGVFYMHFKTNSILKLFEY